MATSQQNKEYILRCIEGLPADKVQEAIDFIEFLNARSHFEPSGLDESSLRLQQAGLHKIWEEDEDLYEL